MQSIVHESTLRNGSPLANTHGNRRAVLAYTSITSLLTNSCAVLVSRQLINRKKRVVEIMRGPSADS